MSRTHVLDRYYAENCTLGSRAECSLNVKKLLTDNVNFGRY